jgi:leucyl aminopeptidase
VVVATGLGAVPTDGGRYDAEAIRRAAGSAVRALAGTSRVASTLSLVNGDAGDVGPAAEGAALAAYDFTRYRTSTDGYEGPVTAVTLLVPKARDRAARAAMERARILAAAVHLARDLVNTAPNDLPPAELAAAAAGAARDAGIDVQILDEKALRKGGYGGILGVGQGSSRPPCLVHLSYRGKRAKQTVALVGKGITFDTGGISIKPAAGMHEMKSDMSGAAAVIAAVAAAAELGIAVNVEAWVPMAENMPGGGAYRPGDVLSMYGGKTVEVLNTDAEGRLILADAIARACEDSPDFLVETSTLTGGQITALGKRVAGLMGDEDFLPRVRAAGERAGEPSWAMPLPEDVRKGMESPVADVSQVNSSGDRAGHMLQGGVFLSHFVGSGVPWAHLDIAGPSYHSGAPYGYIAKGGTGAPVRTLVALLEDIAAG